MTDREKARIKSFKEINSRWDGDAAMKAGVFAAFNGESIACGCMGDFHSPGCRLSSVLKGADIFDKNFINQKSKRRVPS